MTLRTIQFNVGVDKLEAFERKMRKLKTSFEKDGGVLNYTVSEVKIKEVEVPANTPLSDWFTLKNYKWTSADKMAVEYVEVELTWSLKNQDWKVLGIADRQADGQVTYHTSDKGVSIPKSFYDGNIRCDHCQKNRKRNQGIIIQNEKTKELKMVGTACLKDFTGLNVEAILQLFRLAENPNLGLGTGTWTPETYAYNVDELLTLQFCKILKGNFHEEPRELALCVFSIYNRAAERYRSAVRKYLTEKDVETSQTLIEETKEWIAQIDASSDVLYKERPSYYTTEAQAEKYSFEDIRNAKIFAQEEYIKYKDVQEVINLAFMYIYNTGKAKEERDKKIIEAQKAEQVKIAVNALIQKGEQTFEVIEDGRGWKVVTPTDLDVLGLPVKIIYVPDQRQVSSTKAIFTGRIEEGNLSPSGSEIYLWVKGVIKNTSEDLQKYNDKYEKAAQRAQSVGAVGDKITFNIVNVNRVQKSSYYGSGSYYIYKANDIYGGYYTWFSTENFIENDRITGTIKEKAPDYTDKKLITVVLQRVKREATSPIPVTPGTLQVGDHISINVVNATKGNPFKSKAEYDLIKITFTDDQGRRFLYYSTPGSYLDKNLNNIKKIEADIKDTSGDAYTLKNLKAY